MLVIVSVPQSFIESCSKHGIEVEVSLELAEEFQQEFRRYPLTYAEALKVLK